VQQNDETLGATGQLSRMWNRTSTQLQDLARLRRSRFAFPIVSVLGGCALVQPPVTPPSHYLGCFRVETDLPGSYSDSLGYEIPEVVQLGHSAGGQWTVLPTDEEWHPSWTMYDGLPSGYVRRESGVRDVSVMQSDSVARIPGDSIDIAFPSALGQLVPRIGESEDGLGGRAEWVLGRHESYLNEGGRVTASRTSCSELRASLQRTQKR
jgi:hypothetical protein